MNGGYKIIDFSDTNFALNKGVTIKGIHEKVEENTKPLMIKGLEVANVNYDSCFAVAKKETPITISLNGLGFKITITDADLVTITTL